VGVPVIASDHALAEPLTRSRGGPLVAAESEQALAAAILQLAAMPWRASGWARTPDI
jgi:glycosyltransferase involved in cell wall biosynthesis